MVLTDYKFQPMHLVSQHIAARTIVHTTVQMTHARDLFEILVSVEMQFTCELRPCLLSS